MYTPVTMQHDLLSVYSRSVVSFPLRAKSVVLETPALDLYIHTHTSATMEHGTIYVYFYVYATKNLPQLRGGLRTHYVLADPPCVHLKGLTCAFQKL